MLSCGRHGAEAQRDLQTEKEAAGSQRVQVEATTRNMNPDPGAAEADSSLESPGGLEPAQSPDHEIQDLVPAWAPSGKRLISGLLGLNLVLLGSALVAGGAFNPDGLKHQEPQVFMLLLMGVSLVWMLWYLLWARRQPGICPHKDHHAGGVPVTGEPPCVPRPRERVSPGSPES